jgi:hypothetical protein
VEDTIHIDPPLEDKEEVIRWELSRLHVVDAHLVELHEKLQDLRRCESRPGARDHGRC